MDVKASVCHQHGILSRHGVMSSSLLATSHPIYMDLLSSKPALFTPLASASLPKCVSRKGCQLVGCENYDSACTFAAYRLSPKRVAMVYEQLKTAGSERQHQSLCSQNLHACSAV